MSVSNLTIIIIVIIACMFDQYVIVFTLGNKIYSYQNLIIIVVPKIQGRFQSVHNRKLLKLLRLLLIKCS